MKRLFYATMGCAGWLLLFCYSSVLAQQPAFPGAEGCGMYTSGGRGTATQPTTVFEVTSLDDTNTPGTLRYAISHPANYRTIVFRISGTIHLLSRMNIPGNTTIAGQTAPGDGICLADFPVAMNGDNVIIRYIRCRMGDKNQLKTSPANCGVPVAPFTSSCMPIDGSGGDDALGDLGHKRLIIDHCSVSWSTDEAMTIYRGDSVTMQWNFITEPLNYSYHFETGDADFERHGYGGIQGGKHTTIHHNLFAHCRNRCPRFGGGTDEMVDYRNNVVYNHGINTVYGGEGGSYNIVNNFIRYGSSTSNIVKYRVCNPGYNATTPYGKWFVNGNFVDGSAANTENNWRGVNPQGGDADTSIVKVTTAFVFGFPITTETPADAYEAVLQKGGCLLPNRDTLDQRIVNNVRNRNGAFIDVQGGYPHGTPYANTVNAWPALSSTTPPGDTDHDGMPDAWETANGSNPNDASDRNIFNANGYTNLENYLNSLTNPPVNTTPTIYTSSNSGSFSQTTGSPSAAQGFSFSGTNLTTDITITAPANYQVSLNGTTWAGSLILPVTSGSVAYTNVLVRLNAPAPGTYNGNITATSTGATTVSIALTGTTINNLPVPANQKQIIGTFPFMEGGFENQSAGAVSTTVPTGGNTPPGVWTTNGNANIISDGTARTGGNYFTYTSTSGSTKNNYSPAVTSPLFTNGTRYIVQFFYRAPAVTTGNQVGGLLAATDNSGTVNFVTAQSATAYTAAATWQKATYVNSISPSFTANTVFGGFRFNGGGNAIAKPFDVDDFVIYAADNQTTPTPDITAPDAATSPNAIATPDSITITWTAPASGTDGGGYVVVRSTSATPPALNNNGLYSIRNAPGGTGSSVIFLGASPSFIDNGSVTALAPNTTYYYHIFTADKAFNYSPATTIATALTTPTLATTGSLNTFSQTTGTPSASQSFSVSATNLTGNATLTAPNGFELSLDDNTWSTTQVLSPANGTIDPSSIFVRMNAATEGTYSGNITIVSNRATTRTVAVSGSTATILPLVLLSSQAFLKGGGIQVEWKTASENNLTGFVVERSADGRVFSELATLQPENRNSGKQYSWLDAAPFAGDNYYRIKIKDVSATKYSGIMKVRFAGKPATALVITNPVMGHSLHLQAYGLPTGPYDIRVFNATGRQVVRQAITVQGISQSMTVALPHVPAGIYTVQMTNDATRMTQKVVVQ